MVKRRDLMKQLAHIAKERHQVVEIVEGANHTKVTIGHVHTVVPRHKEINEITARAILKQIEEEK